MNRKKQANTRSSELATFLIVLSMIIFGRYGWGYIYQYAMCIVFLIRMHFRIGLSLFKQYFIFFIIPSVAVYLHAILTIFIYHQSFYFGRATNHLLLGMSIVFLTWAIFSLHKKRAIYIIVADVVVYYIYQVINALFHVGIGTFFQNIIIPGSPVLSKWLELHDIGLSLGLVLLYLIFYEGQPKKNIKSIIVLCLIFYMCFKRIAIGAFAVSSVYVFLENRFLDKKNKLITVWGIIGIIMCYTLIIAMSDDSFTAWMWAHGINVMGRDNLYRFFKQYYTISPTFFGRGSGFTGKLLLSGVSIVQGSINRTAAIHSDILRMYIEYGFWGSLLWFSYYLIYLPRKFKEMNPTLGMVFFTCTIYAFIVYITDNTTYYFMFQLFYMLIPLCAMYDGKSTKTIKSAV